MQDDTRKIIDKFEMNVNPNEKIKTLPIAMQAMVTISKISVNDDIRVVIFDEPTALLENEKVEILFKFIAELKERRQHYLYFSPSGRGDGHLRHSNRIERRYLCRYETDQRGDERFPDRDDGRT